MEKDQLSRKLAVILHADVVGSTSLVQQNEMLAHERIQSVFSNFSQTIASYGGTAREIRGDALVAEFDRASDAVTAALAFQSLNKEPPPKNSWVAFASNFCKSLKYIIYRAPARHYFWYSQIYSPKVATLLRS